MLLLLLLRPLAADAGDPLSHWLTAAVLPDSSQDPAIQELRGIERAGRAIYDIQEQVRSSRGLAEGTHTAITNAIDNANYRFNHYINFPFSALSFTLLLVAVSSGSGNDTNTKYA